MKKTKIVYEINKKETEDLFEFLEELGYEGKLEPKNTKIKYPGVIKNSITNQEEGLTWILEFGENMVLTLEVNHGTKLEKIIEGYYKNTPKK